jgi:hypothetical protein
MKINCICQEVKRRLNLGSAFVPAVQNPVSSIPQVKIKVFKYTKLRVTSQFT